MELRPKRGDEFILKQPLRGHTGDFSEGTKVRVTRVDPLAGVFEIIRAVDWEREYWSGHLVVQLSEADKYLLPGEERKGGGYAN